jgi:lipopolysaccharide export system permease protein
VLIAILNLGINPQLSRYRGQLLAQTGTAIALQTVQPGSFRQTNDGHRIIYVENVSGDHRSVKNLFVAQTNTDEKPSEITPWTLLSARTGYQAINPQTKETFFVAVDGRRYQGIPGAKEYYIMQFATYGIRIDSHIGIVNNPQDSLSSLALWRATGLNKPSYFSELQWRIAAPISTVLLALLGIPLSRVNPRQGKYLHVLPAIAIYILYLNLLLIGRTWIENGTLSYQLGLWWIHGALLAIMLLAWCYAVGWQCVKHGVIQLIKFAR